MCRKSSENEKTDIPPPCPLNEKGTMDILPFQISVLDGISALRIFLPKDLKDQTARDSVQKSINEVKKRYMNVSQ